MIFVCPAFFAQHQTFLQGIGDSLQCDYWPIFSAGSLNRCPGCWPDIFSVCHWITFRFLFDKWYQRAFYLRMLLSQGDRKFRCFYFVEISFRGKKKEHLSRPHLITKFSIFIKWFSSSKINLNHFMKKLILLSSLNLCITR